MTIDKTIVRKFKLGEEPSDLAYWLTKTPLQRLETLEFLRQQLYDSTTKGLQRVYTIVKRNKT